MKQFSTPSTTGKRRFFHLDSEQWVYLPQIVPPLPFSVFFTKLHALSHIGHLVPQALSLDGTHQEQVRFIGLESCKNILVMEHCVTIV